MKLTFDKAYCLANRGCFNRYDIKILSFIEQDIITIEDIMNCESPLVHRVWWLIYKCELTDSQALEVENSILSIVGFDKTTVENPERNGAIGIALVGLNSREDKESVEQQLLDYILEFVSSNKN